MLVPLARRHFVMRVALLLALGSLAACWKWRSPAAQAHSRAAASATAAAPSNEVDATLGWPCLHGPAHTSHSAETGLLSAFPLAGPRELWRKELGTGYSSPVVVPAGLVVFHRVGPREVIDCLDPQSGAPRWSYAYPTAYTCKYEYSDGPYSTPTIDAGCVYAVGAEAKAHALRLADGALLWERDLRADYEPGEMLFCHGASFAVDAQRLYLPLGGTKNHSGIIALDKRTGETVWTATDHPAGYATPRLATIHGRAYLFVFNKFGLVALAPATGDVLWEIPFSSRGVDTICATSPVVFQDLILVTMGPAPGALCVRVLPDGSYQEAWRDPRALDSTWNNVVVHEGTVYGFTSKRRRSQLRSLDIATGHVHWHWESDLERGSLLAADGKLFCFGEHGHLALVELTPRRLNVLSQTEGPLLPTPCYPAPSLWQGKLYLKNERTLVCLDVAASANSPRLVETNDPR